MAPMRSTAAGRCSQRLAAQTSSAQSRQAPSSGYGAAAQGARARSRSRPLARLPHRDGRRQQPLTAPRSVHAPLVCTRSQTELDGVAHEELARQESALRTMHQAQRLEECGRLPDRPVQAPSPLPRVRSTSARTPDSLRRRGAHSIHARGLADPCLCCVMGARSLLENVRVKRAGFCYRQRFDKFLERYKMARRVCPTALVPGPRPDRARGTRRGCSLAPRLYGTLAVVGHNTVLS